MHLQVKVDRSSTPSLQISETVSRVVMFGSMERVTVTASSKGLPPPGGDATDQKTFSDDIVDAAWNNGLGVHALVWVGSIIAHHGENLPQRFR